MPTYTVLGVCPDCNGHGFKMFDNGHKLPRPEDCQTCHATGEYVHPLERGLKVTHQSGPDRYGYRVAGVSTRNCVVLVPDDGDRDFDVNEGWTGNIVLTRRRDGQWRERGIKKRAGGFWKFGISENYRSREV